MRKSRFFDAKRQPIGKRKSETRNPKPSAILIVTEGKKTEPLYFQGLSNYIARKYDGSNIDISSAPKLEISGKGLGTVRLVEEAMIIAQRAKRQYSEVWVVFDKDEYTDFDKAIAFAKRNDIQVAWSNSCFEYWLLLHFKADDVARKPPEWRNRVDTEMKKAGLIHVDYDKANTELSDMPTIDGLLKRAVENASRREKKQKASVASKQDPGTTVHHLIASLSPYMQELL